MGYIERQWVGLTRFLDDGILRFDNNPSELALRNQKVGQNYAEHRIMRSPRDGELRSAA